ncbi:class I SAM-dependent methyltransferase [Halalkalibacillus halophilus]|uniref:class I SAM-dependent methyltransferase n=1 Tax=Halalkalibacillus halophilus TaxID=392827 RepID=UPI000416786C|nr:class I SAM-dependent methyltransferase [Halalkalibacillus halophilus]
MDENVFEEMAQRYDTEERKALAEVILKEVRSELQDSESESLMDYGSGTGLVGLELIDLVNSVLLVDSSQGMLEVADAKISQRGLSNANVLCADLTQETPNIKADIVLVSLVLLHIPDTVKILKELHGILNDGGKLLIVDFDKNEQINHPKVHNGFVHAELKNSLLEVGFQPNDIRTFHHGKQIFMNQDASLFLSTSKK